MGNAAALGVCAASKVVLSLHALTACSHCMLSLHALTACSHCMPSLHALTACSHCMLSLHERRLCHESHLAPSRADTALGVKYGAWCLQCVCMCCAWHRLKLVPRVANIEEWVEKGPLSQAEHKLLATYNEKPILTRPQVRARMRACLLSCVRACVLACMPPRGVTNGGCAAAFCARAT